MLRYSILALFLSLFVSSAFCLDKGSAPQPLDFEARIAYQSAIEEVNWSHSVWPKDNPSPKPALYEVIPEAEIAMKVEDYLRKSDALDHFWNQTIRPEQLQAEMDRMVRE